MGYPSKRKKQKRAEDPYKYTARLLRYRLRSEKELKLRLQERYSEEVANTVVEKLKEKGIVDDERFALLFAKDQLQIHRHGPRVIEMKLKSLGVADEVIEKAVKEAWKDFDLEGFLKEVLRKKKDVRKAKEYLYRRGFDPSLLDNMDIEIDRG